MSALEIYPAPADLLQPRIQLSVRKPGEDWKEVPVMFASSMSDVPHARGGAEGWAALSAAGPLECKVKLACHIHNAQIRPSMKDPLTRELSGREMLFTVPSPRYLVIECNYQPDDINRSYPRNTLYLMIDALEENPPDPAVCNVLHPGHHQPEEFDPGSANTTYLMPGVHTVEGEMVDLVSEKCLYLAGGAHLRSYVRGLNVSHASIKGRGVIDGTGVKLKSIEWRDDGYAGFVFFLHGQENLIEGPVIFDSPFWNVVLHGCKGMQIRNHKCITWQVNNDGIQPRSCNDLLVENCFLKCADDCIAVKTRRTAGMQSRNLTFRNLVCWNDLPGNALEIGHTSQADVLENVRFEHIEVVHSEKNHTLSITVIDHCSVRDVVYDGIFAEGVRNEDIKLLISTSRYSTDDERGSVREITIRNYFTSSGFQGGRIEGFDAGHRVENVVFENIFEKAESSNQHPVTSLEELKLSQTHCHNLSLRSHDDLTFSV